MKTHRIHFHLLSISFLGLVDELKIRSVSFRRQSNWQNILPRKRSIMCDDFLEKNLAETDVVVVVVVVVVVSCKIEILFCDRHASGRFEKVIFAKTNDLLREKWSVNRLK